MPEYEIEQTNAEGIKVSLVFSTQNADYDKQRQELLETAQMKLHEREIGHADSQMKEFPERESAVFTIELLKTSVNKPTIDTISKMGMAVKGYQSVWVHKGPVEEHPEIQVVL